MWGIGVRALFIVGRRHVLTRGYIVLMNGTGEGVGWVASDADCDDSPNHLWLHKFRIFAYYNHWIRSLAMVRVMAVENSTGKLIIGKVDGHHWGDHARGGSPLLVL